MSNLLYIEFGIILQTAIFKIDDIKIFFERGKTMEIERYWIENIGHVLNEIRAVFGYTQEQVAERLGISRQQLINIEHGKNYMRLDNLLKLCAVYGIEPGQLFAQAGVDIKAKQTSLKAKAKGKPRP